MTKCALIGASGFVGSNLSRQAPFDELYNSGNIHEIDGKHFDLLVCAGARAEKWKANLEPEADLKNIEQLIGHLAQITAREFILISTVDVYEDPQAVYEDTPIVSERLSAYGKHRYRLEEFVRANCKKPTIIRLPGLFGSGLKKNFIYDMLHKPQNMSLTHSESRFQFYGLDTLWADITKACNAGLALVNLATPSISARLAASICLGREFVNETRTAAVIYDMRTLYAATFDHQGDYIWTKDEEISALRNFAVREKSLKT